MLDSNSPITWDFISKYSWDNPPKLPLHRKKKVEENYQKYLSNLCHLKISIYDILMGELFSNQNAEKAWVIRSNKFPYFMEKNIKHDIIWINPKYQGIDYPDKEEIKKIIQSNWDCECDCDSDSDTLDNNMVYFQNVKKNQSIKNIPHIHVFTRFS